MSHPALPDDTLDVRHLRESAPAKWAALTRTEQRCYDAGRTTALIAAKRVLDGAGDAAFLTMVGLAETTSLPALHAGHVAGRVMGDHPAVNAAREAAFEHPRIDDRMRACPPTRLHELAADDREAYAAAMVAAGYVELADTPTPHSRLRADDSVVVEPTTRDDFKPGITGGRAP